MPQRAETHHTNIQLDMSKIHSEEEALAAIHFELDSWLATFQLRGKRLDTPTYMVQSNSKSEPWIMTLNVEVGELYKEQYLIEDIWTVVSEKRDRLKEAAETLFKKLSDTWPGPVEPIKDPVYYVVSFSIRDGSLLGPNPLMIQTEGMAVEVATNRPEAIVFVGE